jgi:hypothetical protein
MTSTRIAVLLLLACACNRGSEAVEQSSAPAPAAAPAPVDPHAMPPGHPDVKAAPAPSGPASAAGLTWEHATPLVRRAPKSSMRVAEYGLEGDAVSELSVFYFGPDQGGSVDANVTRWLGQLEQPDGSDTSAKAKRSTREVAGVAVTEVEATGAYSGGMAMPGSPAPQPIAEAILLGAIAQGPSGPVFFKLVAPAGRADAARASFAQLIGSIRKTGG